MESTTPTFVSAPEIARAAGVSPKTVTECLKRLEQSPDAILNAGRFSMPLFALPRLNSLVDLVNGGATPVRIEMEAQ